MFDLSVVENLILAHKTQAQAQEARRTPWRAAYASKVVEALAAAGSIPSYLGTIDASAGVLWPNPGAVLENSAGNAMTAAEQNMAYPFIDSMVANVCPSVSPQITVNHRRKDLKAAAKYRETLVNDTFRRVNLRQKLWDMASSAGVVGEAFLKVVWDPSRQTADFIMRDPLFVWFDTQAPSWDRIRYICEATVISREEFDQRVADGLYSAEAAQDLQPGGYPLWLQTLMQQQRAFTEQAIKQTLKWVVVYEFYDLTAGGQFYHFADGVKEPLLADALPYQGLRNPYVRLAFNTTLIDQTPISDVELIWPMLRQLNDLDTLQLRHALATIPIEIMDSAAVDDPDAFIKARATAVNPGQIIKASVNPGKTLNDVLRSSPQPTMSVDFLRSKTERQEQIQYTLGQPAYQRGQSGVDIATEAVLMDSALRTRNGRRQQMVYTVIAWAAEAVVALFQEFLPDDATLYARYDLRVPVELTRETLGLGPVNVREPQFLYDYQVVPGASVENTRQVQLKNMRENWPILQAGAQMGVIKPDELLRRFVELLDLEVILASPEEMAEAQAKAAAISALSAGAPPTGGAPGGAGGAGGAGAGEEAPNADATIAEAAEDPASITGKAVSAAKTGGAQPN